MGQSAREDLFAQKRNWESLGFSADQLSKVYMDIGYDFLIQVKVI
jgi:hypothetical protein